MKVPYKKMAHVPVYTVGFHSSAKSHKSEVYKWVNIRCVSHIPHRTEIALNYISNKVTTLKLPNNIFPTATKNQKLHLTLCLLCSKVMYAFTRQLHCVQCSQINIVSCFDELCTVQLNWIFIEVLYICTEFVS